VLIVWTASLDAKTAILDGRLSGRLEDGHRYQLRAKRTTQPTVRIELVDEGDGHSVDSLETTLPDSGA
jgi:hypothetical protein